MFLKDNCLGKSKTKKKLIFQKTHGVFLSFCALRAKIEKRNQFKERLFSFE